MKYYLKISMLKPLDSYRSAIIYFVPLDGNGSILYRYPPNMVLTYESLVTVEYLLENAVHYEPGTLQVVTNAEENLDNVVKWP